MDEFVRRYADNVSAAGLFLRTKAPKPTGTRIRFDLLLVDGSAALRGEGVVVAVRNDDKPGMSLRFNVLDAESRALVDRIIQEHGNGRLAPTPLAEGLSGTSAAERSKASRTWRSNRNASTGWTSVRGPVRQKPEPSLSTDVADTSPPPISEAGVSPSRWSTADRPWAQAHAAAPERNPEAKTDAPPPAPEAFTAAGPDTKTDAPPPASETFTAAGPDTKTDAPPLFAPDFEPPKDDPSVALPVRGVLANEPNDLSELPKRGVLTNEPGALEQLPKRGVLTNEPGASEQLPKRGVLTNEP
ncbi:MAG: PilZ domain-containing protein, partial [Myxococcota bacterium]